MKLNVDVVIQGLCDGIGRFFDREHRPVTIHDRIEAGRTSAHQSGGPYMEAEIRSHDEDTEREQSSTRLRTSFRDRTVENPDGTVTTEQVPAGEIHQYYWETEIELSVHMPAGKAGYTYTRDILLEDGSTETRTFRYPTVRTLGRIVDDALSHHNPNDGPVTSPLPDPREPDDPDIIEGASNGESLFVLEELNKGRARDRTSGGSDADLLTWDQRVTLDWYRLVDTVERDGPVPFIESVDTPGLDEWEADPPLAEGGSFPGTIVARHPSISPDDAVE